MDNLELLMRAKTYMDKLANGVNPLDDTPVLEDDIVNNIRISRCFFYVSDVLRQVIENGGEVTKVKSSARSPFSITDEMLNGFEYSDYPLPITGVTKRINALIEDTRMKKLSYRTVLSGLKEIGLLEDANGRYGNAKLCPTETGAEVGITLEKRVGHNGTYFLLLYNRTAQEFIVNHLQAMLGAE